jgi:hypothetical protein
MESLSKIKIYLVTALIISLGGCSFSFNEKPESTSQPINQVDRSIETAEMSLNLIPPLLVNTFSGHYEFGANYIDIEVLESDYVKFQGYADWLNENQVIHFGEVAGLANFVDDKKIIYTAGTNEYDCVLEIIFVNENTLRASDNKHCGGLNVTFDGIYTKTDSQVSDWEIYDNFGENL